MDTTYRDLLHILSKLSEDQLDQSVSIFVSDADEYYPLKCHEIDMESGVLDEGSVVLVV